MGVGLLVSGLPLVFGIWYLVCHSFATCIWSATRRGGLGHCGLRGTTLVVVFLGALCAKCCDGGYNCGDILEIFVGGMPLLWPLTGSTFFWPLGFAAWLLGGDYPLATFVIVLGVLAGALWLVSFRVIARGALLRQ